MAARQISPDAHWRDTSRAVQFFLVDYRAMFPLLICLFIPRLWSLTAAGVAILFFAGLQHYGFTVRVFLRLFRGFLAGPRKVAKPWWLKRNVID